MYSINLYIYIKYTHRYILYEHNNRITYVEELVRTGKALLFSYICNCDWTHNAVKRKGQEW